MAVEHLDLGTGFPLDVDWSQAAGPALHQGDWKAIQEPTVIQNNPGGFSGTIGFEVTPWTEGQEGLNVVVMPSDGAYKLPQDSPAILAADRVIREEAARGALFTRPLMLGLGSGLLYPLLDVPLRNVTDLIPKRYLTGILRVIPE